MKTDAQQIRRGLWMAVCGSLMAVVSVGVLQVTNAQEEAKQVRVNPTWPTIPMRLETR